ncbi:MAG: hypothetical protein Q4P08_05310 [Eubacteriales bacterium]|nr:hypothetical protein [Eubacteriales bacterium]
MSNNYEPHLYMICYPNRALVLSQLSPDDFGFKYNYGSASYYSGKLIFAEIDINYRNPYFRIDEAMKSLKPHEDGSPKATKYVSSYRVLEHIEIDAIKTLYLANADGTSLALEETKYEPSPAENDIKVYAELTPLTMLTLSKWDLRKFGHHFTNPENILGVPRLLYLQVELKVDEFLREFDMNPFITPPLEGVHPSKLRDAILDLRARPDKFMKGITLDTSFTKESYLKIKNGFMFMDSKQEKYFKMPSHEEIEEQNLRFFKGM